MRSPDFVTSILGMQSEGKMLFLCAMLRGMKLFMPPVGELCLHSESWQQEVSDTEVADTGEAEVMEPLL